MRTSSFVLILSGLLNSRRLLIVSQPLCYVINQVINFKIFLILFYAPMHASRFVTDSDHTHHLNSLTACCSSQNCRSLHVCSCPASIFLAIRCSVRRSTDHHVTSRQQQQQTTTPIIMSWSSSRPSFFLFTLWFPHNFYTVVTRTCFLVVWQSFSGFCQFTFCSSGSKATFFSSSCLLHPFHRPQPPSDCLIVPHHLSDDGRQTRFWLPSREPKACLSPVVSLPASTAFYTLVTYFFSHFSCRSATNTHD